MSCSTVRVLLYSPRMVTLTDDDRAVLAIFRRLRVLSAGEHARAMRLAAKSLAVAELVAGGDLCVDLSGESQDGSSPLPS